MISPRQCRSTNTCQCARVAGQLAHGYAKIAAVTDEDRAILPTVVMARRILLLGLGGLTPGGADRAGARTTYTDQSLDLAERYLGDASSASEPTALSPRCFRSCATTCLRFCTFLARFCSMLTMTVLQ